MRSVNRPQFAASSKVSIDGAHEKKQQSQLILTELRARAVRMILEHEHAYANQSAAYMAIAPKVGCAQIRFGVGLSNPKSIAASKKDSFACTRIAVALASLWNLA